MTTQQSGFIGPGDAESSQVLVKSLVKAAFRGEPLFRPSRPDFIETQPGLGYPGWGMVDCSGLLGRTSLRPTTVAVEAWMAPHCSGLLGRTSLRLFVALVVLAAAGQVDCSGLLGRTSLRREDLVGFVKHLVEIVPAF